DILKFCYEGTLPDPMPIHSCGILNGIYTISQRNLRALVQLLTDLLSAAASNGELYPIDYEQFLETLKGKEIGIYGGATKCIDDDFLIKIEGTLSNIRGYGNKCNEIFRLLSGEFKPFSVEEIKERANLGEEQAVHNCVEMINQELRKIGVENAICRLEPLKEDKNSQEIVTSLKPVEDEIVLPNSRISIKKFEEETIFYDVDGKGNLLSTIFLLKESSDIARIFDIPEDDAEYLQKRLSNYFTPIAQKRNFILSKELAEQIFPSPTLMLIDFITDRSKRMGLWREAMKNIANMALPLRDGFIEVLTGSDKFKIKATTSELLNLNYMLSSGIHVSIPAVIYATTTRVNLNDVKKLKDLLEKEKARLILLLHVGGIDDDASSEINSMPNILPVHIKPIRAQQLMVLSLARNQTIDINNNILESKLKQFLYELDFGRVFDSWVDKCRKEGILVEDFKKAFGESDRSLAQAMTYFIYTIDEETTLDRVFEESSRLRGFKLYATRELSFAPLDIETLERFTEYYHDLTSNFFVKDKGAGKIQVVLNPVEKRILEIIGKGRRTLEEIEESFVVFAQNEEIFEQVYMPILEAKGLVQVDKDGISRTKKEELERSVFQNLEEYNALLAERKSKPWWSYAHVCQSKEREDKIIMLSDFDQFVQDLRRKYEQHNIKYNEELGIRTLYLIDILVQHFFETLEPLISKAWNQGKTIANAASQQKGEMESLLDRILEDYNRYSETRYSRNDIDEFVNLRTYYGRVEESAAKEYGSAEIEEGLDILNSQFKVLSKYQGFPRYFYYNRPEDQASYFNYKLYQLERTIEAFSTKTDEIKTKCDKVVEKREHITNIGKQVKARLLQYSIDKTYRLSSSILDALMKCQMAPIKAKALTRLSLDDVKLFFEEVERVLNDFDRKISASLTYLDLILSKEKLIISMKDAISKRAQTTLQFFEDFGEMADEVDVIASEVTSVIEKYSMLSISDQGKPEAVDTIDKINDKSKAIETTLSTILASLSEADRKLSELCLTSVKTLEAYRGNIGKFLKVLKEARIDVSILWKAFDETIAQAIQDINDLNRGKSVKVTWKRIWEDLNQIKRKLFDEVKNVLSEDEFNALFAVVNSSTKEKWLDISTLVAHIVSEFGKTE
ncbi:MAG: hypothetical protein QXX08_10855, partial [Candidatus Bathyarchaeia archaeon]